MAAVRDRVLVYQVGDLGDTIVALPAMRKIRGLHPESELILLTNAQSTSTRVSSRSVVAPTRVFNEVLQYGESRGRFARIREWFRIVRRVRAMKPSVLYYLAPTPRTRRQVWRDWAIFYVASGIRDIRGLAVTDDWVGRRDEHGPVPLPSEAKRLLRIVSDDDVEPVDLSAIGDDERRRVDALWAEAGLTPSDIVIGLGVGAKTAAARWPVERYVELASRLDKSLGGPTFLIVGGVEDSPIAERVAQATGAHVVNAAGRLSIWESAEALRRCTFYVGNDSGPMHLAAAVGTACVAIFSARAHPGMWEPQGAGHTVLRTNPPCAGCLLSTCVEHGLVCLTDITVDEVMEACLATLDALKRSSETA